MRFEGLADELLERGDILRSVFLEGAGTTASGSPARVHVKGEVEPEAVVGHRGRVLDVRGLTKRFGGINAVNDVSFDLERGSILGLIGPNGAGKTTIFDLLSGHLTPDGGRVELKGQDITTWRADQRSRLGLGRSFQDARIFPSLTVAENVAVGLERHLGPPDHLGAFLNLPAVQDAEQHVAWTVDDLIELMNLGAFRNKFVGELSTGSRRIVDLAMAIGHDPTLLILDEPSSGIAQKETEALGPLLKRIQAETGCAMLIIEHDMPLITAVSDEILALELGTVVTRGTAAEVLNNPQVISAYLGGDVDVIHRSGASKEAARKAAPDGPPAAAAQKATRPARKAPLRSSDQ